MAIKKAKSQRNLLPGQVRYKFDAYAGEKRKRTTFIARPEDVHILYYEWVRKVKNKAAGIAESLFENFEQYLEQYSKVFKSEKQYKAEVQFYKNRLTVFFEDMDLKDFRRGNLEQYIQWRFAHQQREGRSSRSTINKDINKISSFFKWCILNEKYERANPCSSARFKEENTRHINLTPDQIQELVTQAKEFGELRDAIIIVLYSGIRKTELVNLHWSDIDFISRHINLRPETTKTKKYRAVPIPDFLFNFLVDKKEKAENEMVINIGFYGITSRFEKLRKKLSFNPMPGVGDLKFHDLRHVYAQTLRNAGVSLHDIQAFLGHSSVKTTEARYAQSGGYDGVNKVNRISNIITPNIE